MIRVFIIDEVPLISGVLATILQEEPDIKVVGCATSLDEAVSLLKNGDVALVSTTMPGNSALNLIQSLAKVQSSIKVVAIGLPDSEETILQYVEAGIDGYVLRDDSVDELLQKIRAAHKGEAAISSQIAAALMQRVAELKEQCDDEADPESLQTLTPRETEVLDLLQKQLSNQEIADRLVIELGTVKNHVHSVLKKLNLNSRYDVPRVPASKEIAKKAA
jgi:DNA-binding NarL/FixJ family response regulator